MLAWTSQAKGNAAFSAGRFDEAIEHFTAGIEADPTNHVLYSNRSAAAASKEDYEAALVDAKKVRQRPNPTVTCNGLTSLSLRPMMNQQTAHGLLRL